MMEVFSYPLKVWIIGILFWAIVIAYFNRHERFELMRKLIEYLGRKK